MRMDSGLYDLHLENLSETVVATDPQKSLMIWDMFKCQLTDTVKRKLESLSIVHVRYV